METIQTIKSLLARLAGVVQPMARFDRRPPPRPGRRSELYAPVDRQGSAASRSSRTSRQIDGDDGEAYARRYLERAGLTFVAANVRYRDGEIDLVMREKPHPSLAVPSLVFVEVRRRASGDHGGAAASVTREKRRRIVAAAAHYLVGLKLRTLPPSRFDVVTIDGDEFEGLWIGWIRDAFREEG